MLKTLRTLRLRVGRVMRDVERQVGRVAVRVVLRCWN